jgi:protein XagA
MRRQEGCRQKLKERQMRPLVARMLAACWVLAAGPQVHAQGFTQAKGDARVITSVIWSSSDRAFDDRGHTRDIHNYDRLEVYLLGEYGLTDDVTFLLTPSYRAVEVEDEPDSHGLGYTDVGARYKLLDNGGLKLSVQGLVRVPGQKRRFTFAQLGVGNLEYDLRAQAAYSTPQGHFVIGEAGYRLREGDPANEFHIDGTVGARLAPKLLLLASSYNVFSDGRGSGVFDQRTRYHNVYAGLAYDVAPALTLQLGALGTLAGRNALRERGAFAAAWVRF